MARPLFGLVVLVGLLSCSAQLSSQGLKKFELTADEKTILQLTNAARKEHDLAPLKAEALLTLCAREHSKNMAKQNKMDHVLDGKNPFERMKDVKYEFSRAGENVAYGDAVIPVSQIFEGWMKSPGHRANILQAGFTEIGLGVGTASNGQKYYTQVFGRPLQ